MKVSIADALFTKTQQRVLGLLYGRPARSFYTNEIVRWADMGRGTIRRELERMVDAGLLKSKKEGNQLHYQANHDNPIYDELVSIIRKTFGIADLIHEALQAIEGEIEWSFIYGSVAKGLDTADSDIDLMVVAEQLSYADLITQLSDVEQKLARPINPTLYTKKQILSKIKEENAFVTKVLEQPKLWIKGTEDVIRELG